MRKVTLTRYETGPEGTFGKVVTDNGFQCYSVERPWADNKKNESCILPGPGDTASYECGIVDSPRFGRVFGIHKTPGRENVLIHASNWARQLEGCVALGGAVGLVMGDKGVMGSRDAVTRFMNDLDNSPFILTIQWAIESDGGFL